jgi:predicted Zn-dependent protease
VARANIVALTQGAWRTMNAFRTATIAITGRVLAGALLLISALVVSPAAQTPPGLRLYVVAIGEVPKDLMEDLVSRLHANVGVAISVLSPVGFDSVTFDRTRSQMAADDLILAVRRRYPAVARDARARVIGITSYDMNVKSMRDRWTFTFSLRSEDSHIAVVSYARMNPVNLGAPANDELLRSRLRKMLMKNIGIMYYGLPASQDPTSVLYRDILGVNDLDRVTEDFTLTSAAQPLLGAIHMPCPGARWELTFPNRGWHVDQENRSQDGRGAYYRFNNAEQDLIVSFRCEPVAACRTSNECRELYWKNPGPAVENPKDVKQFDRNGFAIVRFVIPTFRGIPVDQLNYSGHLVRDGYWVDMHLSTMLRHQDREQLLAQFVDSIAVGARPK